VTYDWRLPLPERDEPDCPGIIMVAGLSALSGALVVVAVWVVTALL
jgi:hypothetical protein